MATHMIPTVAEARATANAWLMDHLPDRFAAGIRNGEFLPRAGNGAHLVPRVAGQPDPIYADDIGLR